MEADVRVFIGAGRLYLKGDVEMGMYIEGYSINISYRSSYIDPEILDRILKCKNSLIKFLKDCGVKTDKGRLLEDGSYSVKTEYMPELLKKYILNFYEKDPSINISFTTILTDDSGENDE